MSRQELKEWRSKKKAAAPTIDLNALAAKAQDALDNSLKAFNTAKSEYDGARANPQTKADFEAIVVAAEALDKAQADLQAKAKDAESAWKDAGNNAKADAAAKVCSANIMSTATEVDTAKKTIAAFDAQDELDTSLNAYEAAKQEYSTALKKKQTREDYENILAKAQVLSTAQADLYTKAQAAQVAWNAADKAAQAKIAIDTYNNNYVADIDDVITNADNMIQAFDAQGELDAAYKSYTDSEGVATSAKNSAKTRDELKEVFVKLAAYNSAHTTLQEKSKAAEEAWNVVRDATKAQAATELYSSAKTLDISALTDEVKREILALDEAALATIKTLENEYEELFKAAKSTDDFSAAKGKFLELMTSVKTLAAENMLDKADQGYLSKLSESETTTIPMIDSCISNPSGGISEEAQETEQEQNNNLSKDDKDLCAGTFQANTDIWMKYYALLSSKEQIQENERLSEDELIPENERLSEDERIPDQCKSYYREVCKGTQVFPDTFSDADVIGDTCAIIAKYIES